MPEPNLPDESAPIDRTTDFGSTAGSQESHRPNEVAGSKGAQSPIRSVGGYQLDQLLGEGGMGRVYRGLDTNGRAVAVKLLSPQWTTSDDALTRFKQEGVIASQINHPHCVFVHRVDEDHGTPFIAMELMTGKTLKDLVVATGPLPYKEAVRLILQCIDGLIEAHAQGMIHRDIKPANCYLDDNGNVKIGDFGLARSLVDDSDLTRTGAFLGTPLFASPEQVLGQKVDERSDIYSLTVTLYYLLAGKAPFESPNAAQVIAKIASSDPPSFREAGVQVPRGLENIVIKGLARDRNKRYHTFQELRAELLPIVAPDEEIASLRRRCAAGAIDMIVMSFIASIMMLIVMGARGLDEIDAAVGNMVGAIIVFLYFWISESIVGATIGKRLLRLKVVDAETGRRQLVGKLAIRTASYVAITNSVESIYYLFGANQITWVIPVVAWTGYAMGLLVLWIGWLKTGQRQLTHEWLSGTQTRIAVRTRSLQPVRLSLPEWSIPLVEKGSLPTTIGRFQILGQLKTTDDTCWYSARDKALDREVWIQLLAADELPMSNDRKDCVRRTRMRVIESGIFQDRSWHAYLAPEGIPMRVCLDRGMTLPWPIARQLFHQLIDEERQEQIRIPNGDWGLGRLWIDAVGRATFSEASVLPEAPALRPPVEETFSQIGLCALPPAHRFRRKRFEFRWTGKGRPVPVHELPPYRGLSFLERIVSSGMSMDALRYEIARADEASEQVSGIQRLSHAVIASSVLLLGYAIAVLMFTVGGIIIVERLRRETRELATLSAALQHPSEYEPLLSSLTDEQRADWFVPERIPEVDKMLAVRSNEMRQSYANVGMIERFFLGFYKVDRSSLSQTPQPYEFNLPVPAKPSESKLRIRRTNGRVSSLDSAEIDAQRVAKLTFDDLERTFQRKSRSVYGLDDDDFLPSMEVVCYPLMVVVIWLTIFRGGWFQMLSGVCIARRDGCRVGFLQSFWRSLILFAPFMFLGYLIPFLEQRDISNLWWTLQCKRLFIALPALYLASTLIWPQVGPHDKLSYTAMVPR